MDWFEDELTGLHWFEYRQDHPGYQQYVLALFYPDTIQLPHPDVTQVSQLFDFRGLFERAANFWSEEVERVVVAGKTRGFAVYLVYD
jgi:hypothetical protein